MQCAYSEEKEVENALINFFYHLKNAVGSKPPAMLLSIILFPLFLLSVQLNRCLLLQS